MKQANISKGVSSPKLTIKKRQLQLAQKIYDKGLDLWYAYDYEGALQQLRKAVVLRESLLGKQHIHTGKTYFSLGCALHGKGAYQEALIALRRSMRIYTFKAQQKANKKKSNASLQGAVDYISWVLLKQGWSQCAIDTYHATLNETIDYESQGKDLANLEQYKVALEKYKKAVELETKTMGNNPTHLDYADLHVQMADVLVLLQQNTDQTEHTSEILKYYDIALKIYQATFGDDHPYTIETLSKIETHNGEDDDSESDSDSSDSDSSDSDDSDSDNEEENNDNVKKNNDDDNNSKSSKSSAKTQTTAGKQETINNNNNDDAVDLLKSPKPSAAPASRNLLQSPKCLSTTKLLSPGKIFSPTTSSKSRKKIDALSMSCHTPHHRYAGRKTDSLSQSMHGSVHAKSAKLMQQRRQQQQGGTTISVQDLLEADKRAHTVDKALKRFISRKEVTAKLVKFTWLKASSVAQQQYLQQQEKPWLGTIGMYDSLACSFILHNNYVETILAFRRAYRMQWSSYGGDHPLTKHTMTKMLSVLEINKNKTNYTNGKKFSEELYQAIMWEEAGDERMRDIEDLERQAEEAEEENNNTNKKKNKKTTKKQNSKATNLDNVQSSISELRTQAMELYSKALQLECKAMLNTSHHWEAAQLRRKLGDIHVMQFQYEQAMEQYQKALLVFQTTFGRKHPWTIDVYKKLDAVYETNRLLNGASASFMQSSTAFSPRNDTMAWKTNKSSKSTSLLNIC